MFKRVIRSVRKKPKAVRDQYAFWIAAVFTGVVIVVWLSSFTSDTKPAGPTESGAVDLVPGEVDSLGDMIGELRQEVGNLSESVRTVISTSSATTSISSDSEVTIVATSTAPAIPSILPVGNEVRIATFTATTTE